MSLVRVDVETIVVGGGPLASLVVLKPRNGSDNEPFASGDASASAEEPTRQRFQPLPIRLGVSEAASIGMGVDNPHAKRPMTHDLFNQVIRDLGASIVNVVIAAVEGTTFYASLNLATAGGGRISVDARPSDAIALALRAKAPIFVDEDVLRTASVPDFEAVLRDENEKSLQEFQAFLEDVTPEDFSTKN